MILPFCSLEPITAYLLPHHREFHLLESLSLCFYHPTTVFYKYSSLYYRQSYSSSITQTTLSLIPEKLINSDVYSIARKYPTLCHLTPLFASCGDYPLSCAKHNLYKLFGAHRLISVIFTDLPLLAVKITIFYIREYIFSFESFNIIF